MREWLKNLRVEKNLTMKEVSEKLGISESYYCTIEKGERQKRMDLSLATGIASLFNIPVDQIVAYELHKA